MASDLPAFVRAHDRAHQQQHTHMHADRSVHGNTPATRRARSVGPRTVGADGQGASVAGDPEPVPEHGGAMPAAGVLRAAACCLVGLGKTERYSITLNLLNDQEAATLRGLCEVVCAALASDGAPDATELRSALCEGATYAAYLAPAAGENDAALSAME